MLFEKKQTTWNIQGNTKNKTKQNNGAGRTALLDIKTYYKTVGVGTWTDWAIEKEMEIQNTSSQIWKF